jgi:hypothetical protein
MSQQRPLTPTGHQRLDYLRKRYGDARYVIQHETWGAEIRGAIAIRIDATGWVTDVRVSRLDDELREAATLTETLKSAYASAELTRLVTNANERGPIDQEAVRRGEDLMAGRRRIVAPKIAKPLPITRPQGQVTPRPRTLEIAGRDRVFHGASRKDELSVGIRRTNGLAELHIDAAWLRTTTPQMLRFALKEAFNAAYEEGETNAS